MAVAKLVSVVDDDVSVREAMPHVIQSFGFDTVAFATAEAFLASDSLERTDCLVLDIVMPGMTGSQLQNELLRRNHDIPIVFITTHSNDQMIPDLLRRGAVACIYKPMDETVLMEAVNAAFARGKGA